MALVVKDRVKVSSTTTGTGTFTLGSAALGFQDFSVIGDGNTTYYTIVGVGSAEFEVGIGTFTASGTTLSRDTILESSNAGSAVNFSAGVKEVFVTYPAERSIYTDSAGTTITPATASVLGVASGGTGITSLGTGVATFLGTPSSANLAAAVTDETGSGSLVFATSPTLVTPVLGTPSSGTVTNLTGTASININGTVGATTPATGSFTSLTDSGNLAFTGTGNRITGDFTNATVANRVFFQDSSTNAATVIAGIPNGTGTITAFQAIGNSDPTNASFADLRVTGTTSVALSANRFGTGTFLPLTFSTNGSERMRIDTSGNVGIGTSSPSARLMVVGGYSSLGDFNAGATGTSPPVSGVSFSTNITNGQAEGNIWSTIDPAIHANTGLLFCQRLTSSTRRDLMFLHNNGNVGIGTTSPDANLTVNGAASFAAGTALLPSIARAGDLNTGIFFPAADTVGLATGGVEAARLVSGLLTIPANSTAGSAIRLFEDTDNGTNYVGLQAPASIASDVTFVLPNADGTANQVLKTDGSGNLGFATAGGGGKVLQVVQTFKNDTTSASDASVEDLWADISGMSVTITPTSATSKILVSITLNLGASYNAGDTKGQIIAIQILRGATAIGNGASSGSRLPVFAANSAGPSEARGMFQCCGDHLDSPATTSSTTYKIQWRKPYQADNATIYLNRAITDNDNNDSSRGSSSITVMEIGA